MTTTGFQTESRQIMFSKVSSSLDFLLMSADSCAKVERKVLSYDRVSPVPETI